MSKKDETITTEEKKDNKEEVKQDIAFFDKHGIELKVASVRVGDKAYGYAEWLETFQKGGE